MALAISKLKRFLLLLLVLLTLAPGPAFAADLRQGSTGTFTINGSVGEDLVVLGGTLDIGPSAKVGRDLVIAGGTARVGGSIGRKVLASVDTLTIRGPVGGDVQATANVLRLEDGAAVTGELVYSSENQAF